MAKRTCSVDGCDAEHEARGLCLRHYKRMRRHGSTEDPRLSAEERSWSHVDKSGACWIWRGASNGRYAQFRVDGRQVCVHRVSYSFLVGPVPDGMQLDHLCHNKLCVNPEHLRPVTAKQNQEHHHGGPTKANESSGVRGVTWDKWDKKWKAQAAHNGKNYHGGMFDTIAEAEVAVIELRNRLHTHNDLDRSA